MSWDRIERQEAILREKIAVLVQRLNDPRLGFITITAVKLSRDKTHAKVSYTVLGDEAQIRTTMRALEDASRRIQELLAPSLRMRSMPELRFHYDSKIEKQNRLMGLIEKISEEHGWSASAEDQAAEEDARRSALVDEEGNVPDVPSPAAAWAGEALRAEPGSFEDEDDDEAFAHGGEDAEGGRGDDAEDAEDERGDDAADADLATPANRERSRDDVDPPADDGRPAS